MKYSFFYIKVLEIANFSRTAINKLYWEEEWSLELRLLINKLLSSHQKNCYDPSCFCRTNNQSITKDKNYQKIIENIGIERSAKIKLICSLLEELLKKEITQTNNKSYKNRIVCTYLSFLVIYSGKVLTAAVTLKKFQNSKSKKENEKNNLLDFVMANLIKSGTRRILQRKIATLSCLEKKSVIIKTEYESIDFFHISSFFNKLSKLKNCFKNIIKVRTKFYTPKNSTLSLIEVYNLSGELTEILKKFNLRKKRIEQGIGCNFPSFNLLLFCYYRFVDPNQRLKSRCLSKYVNFSKVKDYARIFKISDQNEEFFLLKTQLNTKDLFRIIYSSKNSLRLTGYTKKELENENSGILMSESLVNLHLRYLTLESISESRMRAKSELELFYKKKDGYLKRARINLKLGQEINSSLELLAFFTPLNELTASFILLADKNHKIECMEDKGHNYFYKGQKLEELNPDFNSHSKKIDLACSELYEGDITPKTAYEYFEQVPELCEAWGTYFRFRAGLIMNLRTSKDEVLKFLVQLTPIFFRGAKDALIVFKIEQWHPGRNLTQVQKENSKNLSSTEKEFLKFYNLINNRTMEQEEDFISLDEVEEFGERTRRNANNTRSIMKYSFFEVPRVLSPKITKNNNSFYSRDYSESSRNVANGSPVYLRTFLPSGSIEEEEENSIAGSSISISIVQKKKTEEVEKYVTYIGNKTWFSLATRIPCILAPSILLVILIMRITLFLLERGGSDMKNTSDFVFMYTWIFPGLYIPIQTENIYRAIREGILPADLHGDRFRWTGTAVSPNSDQNKDYFSETKGWMGLMNKFTVQSENDIDLLYKKWKADQYVPNEEWYFGEINFKLPHFNKDKKLVIEHKKIKRKRAAKYMHLLGLKLIQRNYSDLSVNSTGGLFTKERAEKDVVADIVRQASTGELAEFYREHLQKFRAAFLSLYKMLDLTSLFQIITLLLCYFLAMGLLMIKVWLKKKNL